MKAGKMRFSCGMHREEKAFWHDVHWIQYGRKKEDKKRTGMLHCHEEVLRSLTSTEDVIVASTMLCVLHI